MNAGNQLGTGTQRPYDVVIIDEVGCTLIDGNNKIVRLADTAPGMEYLNPLLSAIWKLINTNESVDKTFMINDTQTLVHTEMKIPRYLEEFVKIQLLYWTNNALLAKNVYQLDHQYMMKHDEKNIKQITPIDYLNTRVIQSSTTWSDGLHQFLQLKHVLKITS
ncbi:unnamed protein product [Didymodactylos carnosus]|uniref:SecA preprotein cross-linking domain-containing protein n=1 Tax=Didymodactylos carnosus TaxID=1234261 RepID=A0A815CQL7_9BILA|nr:unnamed protein product [Didymodactylos carnosus]CAF1283433.1 unnamed protein product [Didymodactylos carnosus]CAF4075317.1 unnamed protein product [Didymodactylos carnosus]CAF4080793.1 unnamed protein product [Didymodactylos carnosus]